MKGEMGCGWNWWGMVMIGTREWICWELADDHE